MPCLKFDTRFINKLPGELGIKLSSQQTFNVCWAKVKLSPVIKPELIIFSDDVAHLLNIDTKYLTSSEMVNVLAGNAILPGMVPYATCYGGHQFGQWAGQLGDGRVIFLGEAINAKGEHWELQLKGAGPTPYSRFADGRAVLRSSIREFLCSEAMHYLGIPTTRALSLINTGELVMRDMFYDGNPKAEPGAIVCRIAPSFIRFGHFELLAIRGEVQLLHLLIDYTVKYYFPDIESNKEDRLANWFNEVCRRTAYLMAHWLRVGFVHGVMNTDNMSILGLTIDYGPYGWIENFDPFWTPNTSDTFKRYCYIRQPAIARWNLERLAEALAVAELKLDEIKQGLQTFEYCYHQEITKIYASKFGFTQWFNEDEALVNDIFSLLRQAEVDMAIFFRKLADIDINDPNVASLSDAFYQVGIQKHYETDFNNWLLRYAKRLQLNINDNSKLRKQRMDKVNPCYILRNYLVQEAIDLAEQGDYSGINELMQLIKNPYNYQFSKDRFMEKKPAWANAKAGCSMLSCSS
jgi:uncharacterized protein YdiU (UPF0061 family)